MAEKSLLKTLKNIFRKAKPLFSKKDGNFKEIVAGEKKSVKERVKPQKNKVLAVKSKKIVAIDYRGVLIRQHITEKSSSLSAKGKYVFEVRDDATAQSIRQAIQSVALVHPMAIHIIRNPRKRVRFGRRFGVQSIRKKAIITLPKGESLDLFSS